MGWIFRLIEWLRRNQSLYWGVIITWPFGINSTLLFPIALYARTKPQSYDYIEGGVANDSVITTVDAYVDGLINAEQAMGKLINEQLRNQICILNQEIIEKYLRFVESIELSDWWKTTFYTEK